MPASPSRRRAGTALALLAPFVAAAVVPPSASAQSSVLVPKACGVHVAPGRAIVRFGFLHTGQITRSVPKAFNNILAPEPAERDDQPTVFGVGPRDDAWATPSSDGQPTTWSLFGIGAAADGNGDPCAPRGGEPARVAQPATLRRDGSTWRIDPAVVTGRTFGKPVIRWERCLADVCDTAEFVTPNAVARADRVDDGGARVRAVLSALGPQGVVSVVTPFSAPTGTPGGTSTPASGDGAMPPSRVGRVLFAPEDADLGGQPRPTTQTRWQRCTVADVVASGGTVAQPWATIAAPGQTPAPESCTDIPGATGRTYELPSDTAQPSYFRTVTEAPASGSPLVRRSELLVFPAIRRGEDWDDGREAAPAYDRIAGISGAARAGEALRADPGTWLGAPAPDVAVRWQRCSPSCDDIAGATGPSYVLTAADVGATVRAMVRASNAVGSHELATAPSQTIAPAPPGSDPPPGGGPSAGDPEVGPPPAPPAPLAAAPAPIAPPPGSTSLLRSVRLVAPLRAGRRSARVDVVVGRPAGVVVALERCAPARRGCPRPRPLALGASARSDAGRLRVTLPRARIPAGRTRVVATARGDGLVARRTVTAAVRR